MTLRSAAGAKVHTQAQLRAALGSSTETQAQGQQGTTPLGLVQRLIKGLGTWFTGREDNLFYACVVLHVRETEQTPSVKVAVREATEFERVSRRAKIECYPWWGTLFILMVTGPHAIIVISITVVSQLVMLHSPANTDIIGLLLFFGSLGLLMIEAILSKIVMDDLNPGPWGRVITRWHQVLTMLQMCAVLILSSTGVDTLVTTLISVVVELMYLSLLILVVAWDLSSV